MNLYIPFGALPHRESRPLKGKKGSFRNGANLRAEYEYFSGLQVYVDIVPNRDKTHLA
jgi:hypothetical protein